MKACLLKMIFAQLLSIAPFAVSCQVKLFESSKPNDSIVADISDVFFKNVNITEQQRLGQSQSIEIQYYSKSSCGRHTQVSSCLLLISNDSIKWTSSDGMLHSSGDGELIRRYRILAMQLKSQFLQQEFRRFSECNFDFILIRCGSEILGYAVGNGGFVFSGSGRIPLDWFEMIQGIGDLPRYESSRKYKRVTERRFLKAIKQR